MLEQAFQNVECAMEEFRSIQRSLGINKHFSVLPPLMKNLNSAKTRIAAILEHHPTK